MGITLRFGELALAKGFVTEAALLEALELQAKLTGLIRFERPIGQILIELGYMTDDQVLETLEELTRHGLE